MTVRNLLLSAVAAGLGCGALFAQSVPVVPLVKAGEPAWRAMIQPQYRIAYSPVRQAQGPEDSSGVALAMVSYDPTVMADRAVAPEYAAIERRARAEIKAAEEAARRYRAEYAVSEAQVDAAPAEVAQNFPDVEVTPTQDQGDAKVVTVAALDPM